MIKQYHLYKIENVLKPQGSLRNESLSLHILEKMKDALESWTDPKYSDSVDVDTIADMIILNLQKEVTTAIIAFADVANKK